MRKNIKELILNSCASFSTPIFKNDYIIEWVGSIKEKTTVNICKSCIDDSSIWFFSEREGIIRNKNKTFFQISGIICSDKIKTIEQPIIVQNEIGYLGIICKIINGTLHFLMQAKIEPGNINHVQISPTIQATLSNFTKQHGGKSPLYLDYFINANKYEVLYDQIQSEQSSRFIGKRNRNIIILVDDEVEESPNHRWMTLYQIKQFMKVPNLVNMDTRTVLSGIPISQSEHSDELIEYFNDRSLYYSMFNSKDLDYTDIFYYINNYKMFNQSTRKLIPLYDLKNWSYNDNHEFVCNEPYSFKLIHCDIEIEGREVRKWDQPLFEATGKALFGLFTCVENNTRLFLVKAKPEIGAFDGIEIGPSVQREYVSDEPEDDVYKLFVNKRKEKAGIVFDNVLSEEGGRFYHEENDNVIIEIDKSEISELPEGYFWVTYRTLNSLIQINNMLNIQLRNLISLLEI